MMVVVEQLQDHSMPTEQLPCARKASFPVQGKHRESTLVSNQLHFKEIVFPSVFVHVGLLLSLKFK